MNDKKFKATVKFYADTPAQQNKYFCWEVNSILDIQACLRRHFEKGYNIRAAYFENKNLETGEIENTRINVQKELDEWYSENTKKVH